jgi:hypothetical protein
VPLLAAATVFCSFALVVSPAARADVLQAHNDAYSTGWYPDQSALAPDVVTGGTFGRLFSSTVSGQVYAQPLVADNTLLVATENDKAYGLDPRDGTQRWSTDLGTPWDPSSIGCADLTPSIGVTGTGVVDAATGTEYVVAKTALAGKPSEAAYAMHALDVETGAERPGFPVAIAGQASNAPNVGFNATHELQRPGLLLLNGVVYAAFGGHCDVAPYTGWAVGVSTAGRLTTMWASQQSGANGSGIWQSGGPLVADGPDRIFLATGNGHLMPTGPTPGNAPPVDLSEAVVSLRVRPDGSLRADDFFTPYAPRSSTSTTPISDRAGWLRCPSRTTAIRCSAPPRIRTSCWRRGRRDTSICSTATTSVASRQGSAVRMVRLLDSDRTAACGARRPCGPVTAATSTSCTSRV